VPLVYKDVAVILWRLVSSDGVGWVIGAPITFVYSIYSYETLAPV
jgi:hypothetical protein